MLNQSSIIIPESSFLLVCFHYKGAAINAQQLHLCLYSLLVPQT